MPATDGSGVYVGLPWWGAMKMHWLENQVVIAFQSDTPLPTDVNSAKYALAKAIGLNEFMKFIQSRGFDLTLIDEMTHLFPSPSGHGTTAICTFNVNATGTYHDMQDTRMLPGVDGSDGSSTRKVVKLIHYSLPKLRQQGKIPVVAAMPNWLSSSAQIGCITGGGPAVPPSPVPQTDACTSSPGFWPITVPALSSAPSGLADKHGDGVTVFVLDTMPQMQPSNAVAEAAKRAGDHNKLLGTIAAQMERAQSPFVKCYYQTLPAPLLETAQDQLSTGRDVNRQIYGYTMPDHGLFVTGIIRDLAPAANIEYIRVLNDFGVGDVGTLISALRSIHQRMMSGGDLYNKPVVINLSLMVGPHDADLPMVWLNDSSYQASEFTEMMSNMKLLRSILHHVIQCLAANGAVIVAAAGNDSNNPDTPQRVGPDYPAAFPEVIAVGSVDRSGSAASYSNYPRTGPQDNGIATYGGGIPTLDALKTDKGIDALRGVYCSSLYPELIATDNHQPGYDPQNPNGWAYWSGTSFATPIVSAIAARILQLKAPSLPIPQRAAEVQRLLTTAAGQQEIFGKPLDLQPDFGVSLLKAEQAS